ncbi:MULTISPECIES: hypothetical protein [Aphanizomenon]|uniref:hypothetical protein n=1 Tax=Aphanizomenon TaxID=1175 RepID=UPI0013623765|nr:MULTISPECIES: hypothetical protein [Aphanizomenon]QSV69927.1 MAG: hypothetical protein HEQ20_03140 [Aphanizomenon flos-aquae KM1D3_PB]
MPNVSLFDVGTMRERSLFDCGFVSAIAYFKIMEVQSLFDVGSMKCDRLTI